MENTVTITLAEWQRLDGLDKQFDEKLKSAVEARIDAERIFVLRDRDEYIRRNEKLQVENQRLRDSVAEPVGLNVKLRMELEKTKADLDKVEKFHALTRMGIDTAESEIKKHIENEKTLRETVNRLREERCELIQERDSILGRGLFSRLFNRRP